MTDMVRKHTVEGSGNWRTIMDVVERTKEMLYQSKKMSRQFVRIPDYCFAPLDSRKRVFFLKQADI